MESSALSDVTWVGVGSTDQESSSSGREKLTPLEQYEQKVSGCLDPGWREGSGGLDSSASGRSLLGHGLSVVGLGGTLLGPGVCDIS